ncbi:acyltransferase [Henriciella sp.]|uniref:acyltransferase family protein n=1 Tax=Henriciella sp. TaxID=1968823 RepID=UPI0025C23E02|nr:acyltransferase [Henriciella sp.]
MKYRAEIDGLRAVAVIPVILFHAGFEVFSGGYVGVDVFFVISGYLITTILINEIENQKFSLVGFYERRARRILPALFFVMLVCIPFAWLWMLPSQLKDFSQSLIAVSFFGSNIFFWQESGYFAAAAEEKPLLHTWTLAVEEQYYIFFPLFLFFAWRFGKGRVFWMIVILAACSLLLSEWGWRNAPTANFYLAPTRAWELFAGSIAAFIVNKRGIQTSNFLSTIGFGAILLSIFLYDQNTPFPSVYALLPVGGTFLVVMSAGKETIVAKLLSIRILVGVGLISYSAYLWHQPLFAFARSECLTTHLMVSWLF